MPEDNEARRAEGDYSHGQGPMGRSCGVHGKDIAPLHICDKNERCTLMCKGVMSTFRNLNADFENLNADSEVKVKVTGIKILVCMERSCPEACVC